MITADSLRNIVYSWPPLPSEFGWSRDFCLKHLTARVSRPVGLQQRHRVDRLTWSCEEEL